MLLAIGTYAIVYGWKFAAGFVALLLVHELGHYIAATQRGLQVGLPTFIPFVGAWIELKDQPMDAETEAFVGIAGPILGSAAAFLCYLAARETGDKFPLALAYAGFMLNLFNLIPLTPLDGGRIVAVISPRIWFFGVPVLIGLFFWRPSPMLILVAVFAAPHLWAAIKDRARLDEEYYRAAPGVRLSYSIQYILLLAFLSILAYETHEELGMVRG